MNLTEGWMVITIDDLRGLDTGHGNFEGFLPTNFKITGAEALEDGSGARVLFQATESEGE